MKRKKFFAYLVIEALAMTLLLILSAHFGVVDAKAQGPGPGYNPYQPSCWTPECYQQQGAYYGQLDRTWNQRTGGWWDNSGYNYGYNSARPWTPQYVDPQVQRYYYQYYNQGYWNGYGNYPRYSGYR